jgi:hypothetical protein
MVEIMESTQTLQSNEKAADFINRWRNLSLHCSHMCMNNLSPDMAIYLQGVIPISFEELASKVMDIENYMQHIIRWPRSFNNPMEKSGQ